MDNAGQRNRAPFPGRVSLPTGKRPSAPIGSRFRWKATLSRRRFGNTGRHNIRSPSERFRRRRIPLRRPRRTIQTRSPATWQGAPASSGGTTAARTTRGLGGSASDAAPSRAGRSVFVIGADGSQSRTSRLRAIERPSRPTRPEATSVSRLQAHIDAYAATSSDIPSVTKRHPGLTERVPSPMSAGSEHQPRN